MVAPNDNTHLFIICLTTVSLAQGELIFADIEFSYPEGKEQRRHVIEIHLEDQDGYPLFSSPINPGFDLGSKFARKGLPGSFLLECLQLKMLSPRQQAVDGKHLIFWGAKTDRSMFPNNLNTARSVICAMERFAPLAGEYSITHGNYTWPTLQNALELTGIVPPEGIVHRAATDTAAYDLFGGGWSRLRYQNYCGLLPHATTTSFSVVALKYTPQTLQNLARKGKIWLSKPKTQRCCEISQDDCLKKAVSLDKVITEHVMMADDEDLPPPLIAGVSPEI